MKSCDVSGSQIIPILPYCYYEIWATLVSMIACRLGTHDMCLVTNREPDFYYLAATQQVIIGGVSGGGGFSGGGVSSAVAGGGGAAAEAPPPEKEEEKEESDDDMGFSLFD